MWACASSPGFYGGGFPLFAIVIGIVALVLVLWAIRSRAGGRGDGEHRQSARADRDDAMRILRLRLAEGAITEEEYERLRRAVEC